MISHSDNAIILTCRKHAESSALVEVLTATGGLYKGVVRGAFSAKSRGVWQPGNQLAINWSARLPEHMGSITGELITPNAAHIMPDKQALALLNSACSLLAVALPERHAYPKLYNALLHLLAHLAHAPETALPEYVDFELLLLSETGFGLDFSQCAATGSKEDLIYVSPKSGRAVSSGAGEPYKDKLLPNPAFIVGSGAGLITTGYFLEHWLFESLHRKLPAARMRLQAFATRDPATSAGV